MATEREEACKQAVEQFFHLEARAQKWMEDQRPHILELYPTRAALDHELRFGSTIKPFVISHYIKSLKREDVAIPANQCLRRLKNKLYGEKIKVRLPNLGGTFLTNDFNYQLGVIY